MYVIPKQPQILPQHGSSNNLAGYLQLDNSEYFVSANFNSMPPIVDYDNVLKDRTANCQHRLLELSERSSNAVQFITDLTVLLKGLIPSYHHKSETLSALFKQIKNLSHSSLQSIDKDFKHLTLQCLDASGRSHKLIVDLTTSPPGLTADLPEPLTPFSGPSSLWSCSDLLKNFKQALTKYQALWDVLDDIDANAWVIEPVGCTRGYTHRRIVVKDGISLIIQINTAQPSSLPHCTFLGPRKTISSLQNSLDENAESWDMSCTILENLTSILDTPLPTKPDSESAQEVPECGVCYCYDLSGAVPEVVCARCNQLYHTVCLVEWFRGLPGVRQSFGTLFGECPYCNKPLHIQAVL